MGGRPKRAATILLSGSLGCSALSGLSDFEVKDSDGSGGATGGSGGSGDGGAAGAYVPTTTPCPFHADTFDGAMLDSYWMTSVDPADSAAIALSDGALALALPAAAMSRHAAVFGALASYDGCSVSLELLGTAGMDQEIYFALGADPGNTTGFLIANGELSAGFRVNGVPMPVAGPFAHDGSPRIIVAMTFQGAQVTFATSRDGARWTTLDTATDPNTHDNVSVGFGISALGGTGNLAAVVDDFNIYVP